MLTMRALPSILRQTVPVATIAVEVDHDRSGAPATRNRALDAVLAAGVDWVGFLDDDDELLPHHVETLLGVAGAADVVWGWFEVVGGTDPFPQHRGRRWDPADPHIFPIPALVRAEAIFRSAARFSTEPDPTGNWAVQDFPFWRALWDGGARFLGVETITWRWYHHGANTSGLAARC